MLQLTLNEYIFVIKYEGKFMNGKFFSNEDSKRLLPVGICVTVIITFIVISVLVAASRLYDKSYDLADYKDVDNNWKYEILTESGASEYKPVYTDYLNIDYGLETPYAVRISREMKESIVGAELVFYPGMYQFIEVKLDNELMYSEFDTSNRDENGFYILDEEQRGRVTTARRICLNMPEDYIGKTLTVTTYFSEGEMTFRAVYPSVENDATFFWKYNIASIPVIMIMLFCGIAVIALCAVYVMGLYHGIKNHKILFMVAMFILLLIKKGSELDYSIFHSNSWFEIIGKLYLIPMFLYAAQSMNRFKKYLLTVCSCGLFLADFIHIAKEQMNGASFYADNGAAYFAAMILFLIMFAAERLGQNKKKIEWRYILLFAAVTAVCLVFRETDDSTVIDYMKNVILSITFNNFKPIISLLSDIYIIMAFIIVIVKYIKSSIFLNKQLGVLEAREYYAVENYRIIQQAEKETKELRHEMRHHTLMLREFIQSKQFDKAEDYIERVFKAEESLPIGKYSNNFVINAIVSRYMNSAKAEGIDTQCEIFVNEAVNIKDEDICVLLTNILENAVEACKRMTEDKTKYIRLKINADEQFFYVNCINSTDGLAKRSRNKGFKTSKENESLHGYGIIAIQRIARRYYGSVKTDITEESFSIQAILQMN